MEDTACMEISRHQNITFRAIDFRFAGICSRQHSIALWRGILLSRKAWMHLLTDCAFLVRRRSRRRSRSKDTITMETQLQLHHSHCHNGDASTDAAVVSNSGSPQPPCWLYIPFETRFSTPRRTPQTKNKQDTLSEHSSICFRVSPCPEDSFRLKYAQMDWLKKATTTTWANTNAGKVSQSNCLNAV